MLTSLYRSIRLIFKKKRGSYASFFNILGFYPDDLILYEQAFVHRSSSIQLKNGRWINNERLEFLGDAIFNTIVTEIIYKEFEYRKEGFLTNVRARIVQRESMNALALKLGIDKLIRSSARRTSLNTNVYGNALEALIGAIFLDKGYYKTKQFVEKQLISQYLDMDMVAITENNYKSQLIEWSQKNKIPILFNLVESFLDQYNTPYFKTVVLIFGESVGEGSGLSKKESQQNAAKEAISKVKDLAFYEYLMTKRT